MDNASKTPKEHLAELRAILAYFHRLVNAQQEENDKLQKRNEELGEEKTALVEENKVLEAKWEKDHQTFVTNYQNLLSGDIKTLKNLIEENKTERNILAQRKGNLDDREKGLDDREEKLEEKEAEKKEKPKEENEDKKELKQRIQEYPALRQKCKNLEDKVKELEGKIGEKDKDIKERDGLIEQLKNKIRGMENSSSSALQADAFASSEHQATNIPIITEQRPKNYEGYGFYGRSGR